MNSTRAPMEVALSRARRSSISHKYGWFISQSPDGFQSASLRFVDRGSSWHSHQRAGVIRADKSWPQLHLQLRAAALCGAGRALTPTSPAHICSGTELFFHHLNSLISFCFILLLHLPNALFTFASLITRSVFLLLLLLLFYQMFPCETG